jgi:hypothetical protein
MSKAQRKQAASDAAKARWANPPKTLPALMAVGDADVENLAGAWLSTYLQVDDDEYTADYAKELASAKREMAKAAKRAGLYRRKSPNDQAHLGGVSTHKL